MFGGANTCSQDIWKTRVCFEGNSSPRTSSSPWNLELVEQKTLAAGSSWDVLLLPGGSQKILVDGWPGEKGSLNGKPYPDALCIEYLPTDLCQM